MYRKERDHESKEEAERRCVYIRIRSTAKSDLEGLRGRRMYGHIQGITDTDTIYYCPFCGERMRIEHADGTVTCKSCGRRFGVVEQEED